MPASGNLLKYERVEMFYHREPNTYAKFVELTTKSGKKLSLTRKFFFIKLRLNFFIFILALHLIPVGNCKELLNNNLSMENIQDWLRKSRFYILIIKKINLFNISFILLKNI